MNHNKSIGCTHVMGNPKYCQDIGLWLWAHTLSKTDDKDPCQRVPLLLSDSSEKEAALRLFGLASTIVEGSFYGMSMAKKEKKSLFLSRKNNTHKSDSRQWDKSQNTSPIHMCLNL